MGYNETSIKDAKVMTITPAIAADILSKNGSNRNIRNSVVKSYASDMLSGVWKVTHQGIAISSNGKLVDGQHRLSAIILANIPVDMLVITYNEEITAINSPLDLHAKRSISDILGRDSHHMAAVAYVIKNLSGSNSSGRSESKTIDFLDKAGDKYDWMVKNISGINQRLFSSAPIRAACFVAYIGGRDWSEQYNLLATNNIKEIDSKTYLLYKKLVPYNGLTGSTSFRDIAFTASFAVAIGMMDSQERFTSQLLERSREKALSIVSPYFK